MFKKTADLAEEGTPKEDECNYDVQDHIHNHRHYQGAVDHGDDYDLGLEKDDRDDVGLDERDDDLGREEDYRDDVGDLSLPIGWSEPRLPCSGCERCSSSLLNRQNAQTITLHPNLIHMGTCEMFLMNICCSKVGMHGTDKHLYEGWLFFIEHHAVTFDRAETHAKAFYQFSQKMLDFVQYFEEQIISKSHI